MGRKRPRAKTKTVQKPVKQSDQHGNLQNFLSIISLFFLCSTLESLKLCPAEDPSELSWHIITGNFHQCNNSPFFWWHFLWEDHFPLENSCTFISQALWAHFFEIWNDLNEERMSTTSTRIVHLACEPQIHTWCQEWYLQHKEQSTQGEVKSTREQKYNGSQNKGCRIKEGGIHI